jgi:hypothetical protein
MTTSTLADRAVREKPSFVYVIGCDGSSRVKIGKSNDVAKRFGSIQRMSPVELRLLAYFPGGLKRERALHEKFAHLRTYGEWFDFGDRDPVAEVSAAVAALVAADEAEARAAAERTARPGTVVRIRRKLWVMRGDGQFQCVDSVQGKRRCRNLAVDIDALRLERLGIHIGIGTVEGYAIPVRTKADEERIMMQFCQAHYDRFDEERYWDSSVTQPAGVATRPMWEPFDPLRHADLITPDAVDAA